MKTKKLIPLFPKEIRDEILNYTDDKEHKSFLKVLDSKTFYKCFMGAKNVSKSFGCMIEAIFRIINDPLYNAMFGRNLSKDIVRTIRPTFQQAISFLAQKYDIDYSEHFDVYMNQIIFKPTGQGIYFGNFELANSFAGITLPVTGFYFGDLFLDEIQQNPLELGDSKNFSYEKQEADLEFIIQATVLRTPAKEDQQRRIVFTFNVYDSDHWVCNRFVKPLIPFSKQNREKIVKFNYLFAESEELNCSVMRMSRFYVPEETISPEQKKYYDDLLKNNPKLYDITVAGEAYDIENPKFSFPFKKYLLDDGEIDKDLIVDLEKYKNKFIMTIDGYDPGLRDKNGWVRVSLTENYEIVVWYAQEIDSKDFSNFKRFTTTQYLLASISGLNKNTNIEASILAIDSKDDSIMEIAIKHIAENNLNISPVKAIKNKNPSFEIDFSLINRAKFLIECFQKKIIHFTPNTFKLIEYLCKMAIPLNEKRDEKINPEIYDLLNAFEYALSVIYHIVIIQNKELKEARNAY